MNICSNFMCVIGIKLLTLQPANKKTLINSEKWDNYRKDIKTIASLRNLRQREYIPISVRLKENRELKLRWVDITC